MMLWVFNTYSVGIDFLSNASILLLTDIMLSALQVRIAMVGKYTGLSDAYLSVLKVNIFITWKKKLQFEINCLIMTSGIIFPNVLFIHNCVFFMSQLFCLIVFHYWCTLVNIVCFGFAFSLTEVNFYISDLI